MKILIAAGIYPPDAGGPAVHAKAQFEGLPKLGVETSLVALSHYRHWPRWVRHLLFFGALITKATRSEVIYAHDAWGVGFPALMAARLTGNKIVVRVGGDLAWEQAGAKLNVSMLEWYDQGFNRKDKMFLLSRFVLRQVDRIIVTAPLLQTLYERYYGLDPSKIKIIYNPVPGGIGIMSRQEKTIIYASRLVGYKNLPMVLEVLAKIFPTNPDLRFIIMGDGPDKDHLVSLTKDLGIDNNVIFTGAITQKEVFERTSSCLFAIAPALTEFNPNYILQCFGFGKPFLISREHGLPFEVPDEFMFNSQDKLELQQRIESLLDRESYEQALKRLREIDFKMTWDDNLQTNLEVLRSIV